MVLADDHGTRKMCFSLYRAGNKLFLVIIHFKISTSRTSFNFSGEISICEVGLVDQCGGVALLCTCQASENWLLLTFLGGNQAFENKQTSEKIWVKYSRLQSC